MDIVSDDLLEEMKVFVAEDNGSFTISANSYGLILLDLNCATCLQSLSMTNIVE